MPVITRQQARQALQVEQAREAKEAQQLHQEQQAQQAQQEHALSRTNLNNLPAEIIQEIARQLNPEEEQSEVGYGSDFADVDCDRMPVDAFPLKHGPRDTKVMPCCRWGDPRVGEGETGIPVLNNCSVFSATSKRIRDIVFHRRQRKQRTIRFCNHWTAETKQIPEAVRARYE